MDRFVELYRAANTFEAHALKGALEQQGVMVRLLGEALAGGTGELPIDSQEVGLLVQSKNFDQANQVLEEYHQSKAPWQCPSCGEQNDGHFETCWRCSCVPEA